MDSFDIFQQLTKGTKFNKKKQNQQKKTTQQSASDKFGYDSVHFGSEINNNFMKISSVGTNISTVCNTSFINTVSGSEYNFKYVSDVNIQVPHKKIKRTSQSNSEKNFKLPEEQEPTLLRKQHGISVVGKHIPRAIASFDELFLRYKIHDQLIENINMCKYSNPTAIQMQAIPIMLEGRSLMACAPTGSGKTVAFLAPIINSLHGPQSDGFRAIILAPTRELAQQIYRDCVRLSEKTALKIHLISKVKQANQKFGPDSNMKFDILISTPNRVRFLLKQEPPVLTLKSIEWFVIDEADRLMEDGQNNFKEQMEDILLACTNPCKKIALFSATNTVPVAKWAIKKLKNLVRITIGYQNTATATVKQKLLFVGNEGGKLLAIRDLVRSGLKPPVLIFVQSKDRAKQLFQELLYDGINVDVIHGERTRNQRDNCIRAFRDGRIWVLICTELISRGMDFKGINLVINYDFPPSTISYIHRIGRTGRAGRQGEAITLFTQNDTQNLKKVALIIKNSGGKVPNYILQMKNPRKSDLNALKNFAPKREDISTSINLKPQLKKQDDSLKNSETT